MKAYGVLIISVILAVVGLASSQSQTKVDSRVVAATVFSNRAQVVREATVTLVQGTRQLVFSNLTPGLLDESVRVSGQGAARLKILDVQVELHYTAEIQEKVASSLQNNLDSLKVEDQLAADKISIAQSQKNFIESLQAETAKDINQKIAAQKPEVRDWQEMLVFINNGLDKIYSELRKQNGRRKEIRKAMSVVRQQLEKNRALHRRSFKEISVTMAVKTPGQVKLQASYVVDDASWSPLYDVRVSSKSKKMELTYYALVRQNTGEHWEDVALTLSTAQPLMTQTLPELPSWFVDVHPPAIRTTRTRSEGISSTFSVLNYRRTSRIRSGKGAMMGTITDKETGARLPGVNVVLKRTNHGATTGGNGFFNIENVPVGVYDAQVSFIGYRTITARRVKIKEGHVTHIQAALPAEALEMSEINIVTEAPEAETEFEYTTAEVRSTQISAVFELPTENNIPSDGIPHKVTIAIEPFDVQFSYLAVPKITPKVFLQGKVVNKTAYPLLAGNVNVFIENDFINKTFLETIVPLDSFELSLGIDEAIKVERKLINRFTESNGVFTNKRKITYDYEIRLTNNRKTTEQIRVSDQLPISNNEKIKIQLLEPDKKQVQLDNLQRLTWHVHLKPNERKTLPFKYQIEFPASTPVYGLE